MKELKSAEERKKEFEEKKLLEIQKKEQEEKTKQEDFKQSTLEKFHNNLDESKNAIDQKLQTIYCNLSESDEPLKKTFDLLNYKELVNFFNDSSEDEFFVIMEDIFEYLNNHKIIIELSEKKYIHSYGWGGLFKAKLYIKVSW